MAQRRRLGFLMALLVALSVSATGCSVVGKVKTAVHNVEGNKATIDSFTQNLQSRANAPFEATYATTGSAPATIVYAVDRPAVASPSTRRRRDPTRPTCR